MKNSEAIEMLTISRDRIERYEEIYICNAIGRLTNDGYSRINVKLLTGFFKNQRPTRNLHQEFYNNELYCKYNNAWWASGWSVERKEVEQRVLFLNMLINGLSNGDLNI